MTRVGRWRPGSPEIKQLTFSLLGAGRMGRQILAEMAGQPSLALGAVWVRPGNELLGRNLAEIGGPASGGAAATSDIAAALRGADVAIDFSLPSANDTIVAAVVAGRIPLVCGVSGLDERNIAAMRVAARTVPVFHDRNMSLGVAVMRRLSREAATLLGDDFPVAIHDIHHAGKRDAPSGTALLLGESVADGHGRELAEVMQYEAGGASRKSPEDIVFEVTRAGDCPGRHDVHFAGSAERLTLVHEVSDRAVFAQGALRAARWLATRPPGFYDMQDLLDDLTGAR